MQYLQFGLMLTSPIWSNFFLYVRYSFMPIYRGVGQNTSGLGGVGRVIKISENGWLRLDHFHLRLDHYN